MRVHFSRVRKRIKVRFDPNGTESKKPSNLIIKNLLLHSQAVDFDQAKEEWSVQYVIDDSCEEFSDKCQLCHTTGLKNNFIIENSLTGAQLRVGSTCIIRFRVGKGIFDVESGVTLLQNLVDEQYLINQIQTLTNGVLVYVPEANDVRMFTEYLRKLMDIRGIKNPSDEQLGEVMFGPKWRDVIDPFKLDRMRCLWHKPAYIMTHKSNKKYVANPKEGTTFGYKRRRGKLSTSFGYSGIYNVEKHVTDKRG